MPIGLTGMLHAWANRSRTLAYLVCNPFNSVAQKKPARISSARNTVRTMSSFSNTMSQQMRGRRGTLWIPPLRHFSDRELYHAHISPLGEDV